MTTKHVMPTVGQWIKSTSGRVGRVTKTEVRSNMPAERDKVIPGLFIYADYAGKYWFGLSHEWEPADEA